MQTVIDEGWVSRKWYEKEPVDVAQFTLEGDVPAVFVTVLYPTPADQAVPPVSVTRVSASVDGRSVEPAQATAFEVVVDDSRGRTHDLWVFRHTDEGEVVAGDARLDGRMARIGLDESSHSWMVAESAALAFGQTPLFQAAESIDSLSRIGGELVSSDAAGLRVWSDAPCRLNGAEATPPVAGVIGWDQVAAPATPPEPKAFDEARVEIAPPPEMVPATGFATMMPAGSEAPEESIRVNAAEFSDQGGGAVETTSRKVGAEGPAFLHWDNAGHWLEYTLNVPQAGAYRLLLRACTAQGAAHRRISVNGEVVDACQVQELAGTGGYSSGRDDWRVFTVANLKAQPVSFDLPAGTVVLRLENIDGRSLNLNWLGLAPDGE
jgi:hypothetical protein